MMGVSNYASTYNTLGLLDSYNDGQSSAVYEYDSQQRKISETVTYRLGQVDSFSKSHQYSYDKRGNKKSFTDPQGTAIQYFYNDNNQLNALIIPTVGTLSFSYQWQAPSLITLPGGHRIEYQYDGLLRPKQIAAIDSGDNPIHRLDYEYDVVNNITRKQIYRGVVEDNGVVDYDYNELDRLTGVDYSANINGDGDFAQGDEGFSYDLVGNRKTDAKTGTNNWSYNKNNELQSFDNTSFKYNLNGQMTEKTVNGQKTTYSYNLDGRLSEIKDNSNQVIAQYQYDPFGRRLSKTLPQDNNKKIYFHYSYEGLIAEYSETGLLVQSYGYEPDSLLSTDPIFTHRPDFTEAKGYSYYIKDHLGTPQKLITNTGRKVWEASADAFGKTIITNDEFRNPFRFPGQYKDDESQA